MNLVLVIRQKNSQHESHALQGAFYNITIWHYTITVQKQSTDEVKKKDLKSVKSKDLIFIKKMLDGQH